MPPHAPCRLQPQYCASSCRHATDFASTRPVQIATESPPVYGVDCRFASTRPVQIATVPLPVLRLDRHPLPPHAPCRLQHAGAQGNERGGCFASTRPVQIATTNGGRWKPNRRLCLHTPRADCNARCPALSLDHKPLPPHAPCRLQLPRWARTGRN